MSSKSFPNLQIRNKDIDTTLSYSDNCGNDISPGTRKHAINFYCGADPPFDSLLAGQRTSVNSSSSSSNNSSFENSDSGSSSEGDSDIPTMMTMCGTAHMSRTVWQC